MQVKKQRVDDQILEALESARDQGLDDLQLSKILPGVTDEERI
jgi:hypothetical protein